MNKQLATSGPMKIRRLKSGGYELLDDWWVEWYLLAGCSARSNGGLVHLIDKGATGRLLLKSGYRSDGPSGPLGRLDDTDNFIAAAFAHDGGFELCRECHVFPWQVWEKIFDKMIVEICRTRKMSWLRRKFIYLALRLAGASSAKPQPEIEDTIIVVP